MAENPQAQPKRFIEEFRFDQWCIVLWLISAVAPPAADRKPAHLANPHQERTSSSGISVKFLFQMSGIFYCAGVHNFIQERDCRN